MDLLGLKLSRAVLHGTSPCDTWESHRLSRELPQECAGCSTELSGLDSSKANGGPVAYPTLLFPFFLYSSGTVILLFLERFLGFFVFFPDCSKGSLQCPLLF